jgi:AcrR family transcriptional regulator
MASLLSRGPRGSLSRHAVVDAALSLVDRVGVDGLTVRGLARELGRPPMTLYVHFDSKRELLDLSFDRLLERLFTSRRHATTWQAEFEEGCAHMRRVLLKHPHWIALLTRVKVPMSALDFYDRMLGQMSRAGFRPEAAMFAFSAVMSHALGSVLVERLMDGHPSIPKQRLKLVKGLVADKPRGSYRRIEAVAPKFDRWSFDHVFSLGTHSLIAGLEACAPRRNGSRRDNRRGNRVAGTSHAP